MNGYGQRGQRLITAGQARYIRYTRIFHSYLSLLSSDRSTPFCACHSVLRSLMGETPTRFYWSEVLFNVVS